MKHVFISTKLLEFTYLQVFYLKRLIVIIFSSNIKSMCPLSLEDFFEH